ncbi:hypothetical protein WM28_09090 [Burkholderia ubonensis]|nr:hypothetical protein WM28_09090 [Burkholderia ubonensis]
MIGVALRTCAARCAAAFLLSCADQGGRAAGRWRNGAVALAGAAGLGLEKCFSAETSGMS